MSWVCNAQAPPALTGTLAPSSSKPFRLSSFSDASAFLFSRNCLSPLLEHSAYSCQTQGHRRLKELGQEESSGFVCPSSRASGACVSVYGCMPVCLGVPVSAHMGVYMYVHMCACTVCVWACILMCLLVFVHTCVCVCVCVCALCACVKREESPDCLEISQDRRRASYQAPVTAIAHGTEPLGKVAGHLGQRREEMK